MATAAISRSLSRAKPTISETTSRHSSATWSAPMADVPSAAVVKSWEMRCLEPLTGRPESS